MEIDLSRLTRSYNLPFKKKELIPEEDLKYLYIELNLCKNWIVEILKVTRGLVDRSCKAYGFRKDNKTINKSQQAYLMHKYGVRNAASLESSKQKSRETCLKRYGVEYSLSVPEFVEKRKKTCIKKYGVDNPSKSVIIKEKKRNTFMKHYGVDSGLKSDLIKAKVRKTVMEQNGGFPFQKTSVSREKYEATMMKKYKCTNPMQNEIIAAKTGKTKRSEEYQEKQRQKNMQKYGVTSTSQLPDVQRKINETKRKNKSYNTSSPEDSCYLQLREKYETVCRQYSSELYPFACDFYIPEDDLYIECNFMWTHGTLPFNKNDAFCVNQLKEWQEKAKKSKFYKNAVYTWTELDVRKLKTAQANNLNFLVFYSPEDFKKWINQ